MSENISENIYLLSLFASVIFLVIKFLDIRFIKKEEIDLKNLGIDSIIVYFSSIASIVILKQFGVSAKTLSEPHVFLDEAKF